MSKVERFLRMNILYYILKKISLLNISSSTKRWYPIFGIPMDKQQKFSWVEEMII